MEATATATDNPAAYSPQTSLVVYWKGCKVLTGPLGGLPEGLFQEATQKEEEARQAVKRAKLEVEQGPASLQYELGTCWEQRKNYPEAVYWYAWAATKNHAESQFRLGLLCYEGKGVKQSDKWAAFWFEEAADNGHIEACRRLAQHYHKGLGVRQSDAQAACYLTKAAKLGDAQSQFHLALLYGVGQGVQQSDPLFLFWLGEAARGEHQQANALLVKHQQEQRDEELKSGRAR